MAVATRLALPLLYLALPGHPVGWLNGLPLGPLELAVLVLYGLTLFAASSLPRPADTAAGRGTRNRLAALLGALCLAKLLLGAVAPLHGFEASYFGRPGSPAPPERSTEYPRLAATRIDPALWFEGDDFPVYFFNDNVRFNFYRSDQPSREALPFAARWQGLLEVPAEGRYQLWFTAIGTARLELGSTVLRVDNRWGSETAEAAVDLAAGLIPLEVTYERRSGAPAQLVVESDLGGQRQPLGYPTVLARPGPLPAYWTPALVWLAHGVDLLSLLATAALVLIVLRPAIVQNRASLDDSSPGSRLTALERPLLAALLAGVFAYAAFTSLPLHNRAVLLGGGEDWLTYETYARDILLNGPLMTLGKELGNGRPFYFQPGYPYVLAAFHWLTGEDLYGVVVLQLFGIGVAAVLVYFLARFLYDPRAGLLALAIVIGLLGPLQLEWVARHLLSENVYFWLVPAAALALVRLIDRPSWRLALLGGALLGACCVVRGPTLLWLPPALLTTWLGLRRGAPRRSTPSRPLATIALVVLACAAVVALVPLRNGLVAGQATLVATNGMATMEIAHPVPPSVDAERGRKNPIYRALKLDFAVVQMLEFVRQEPLGYLATLLPLGLYALGLPGVLEPGSAIRWELVSLVALYLLLLARSAGRWTSLRDSLASPTALLHSFIGLHFLMMMVFLPNIYGYRQVLPMYVLGAVFAGAMLVQLVRGVGHLASTVEQQRYREQRDNVEQHVPRAGAAPHHEELA